MNTKINESEMLARLKTGAILLPPLLIHWSETLPDREGAPDAIIELAMPDNTTTRFVVEAKSRSTPEAIHTAVMQAKAAARGDERPLIQVPYLSPERLEELEREQVSGIDLCGNGVVIIPGRLLVIRSGQPNCYRDSRPLNNPYRGRSAMVARMLLTHLSWPSLGSLVSSIRQANIGLSLAQTSKAIRALEEDLIVAKFGKTIKLQEPGRLLDRLASEWRKPIIKGRATLRLPMHATQWAARLSSDPALQWAVTGETSASRYVMFSQTGPSRIAVSDLARSVALLGGTPEPVPNFADIELLEMEEPGIYFANVTDSDGVRWAIRLHTWLELRGGDARQQEAARDLRQQLLREDQP